MEFRLIPTTFVCALNDYFACRGLGAHRPTAGKLRFLTCRPNENVTGIANKKKEYRKGYTHTHTQAH